MVGRHTLPELLALSKQNLQICKCRNGTSVEYEADTEWEEEKKPQVSKSIIVHRILGYMAVAWQKWMSDPQSLSGWLVSDHDRQSLCMLGQYFPDPLDPWDHGLARSSGCSCHGLIPAQSIIHGFAATGERLRSHMLCSG